MRFVPLVVPCAVLSGCVTVNNGDTGALKRVSSNNIHSTPRWSLSRGLLKCKLVLSICCLLLGIAFLDSFALLYTAGHSLSLLTLVSYSSVHGFTFRHNHLIFHLPDSPTQASYQFMMKASYAALFAVAAVVNAQSASDFGVPACAVSSVEVAVSGAFDGQHTNPKSVQNSCFLSAISNSKCAITDFYCQCSEAEQQIQTDTLKCLCTSTCSTNDLFGKGYRSASTGNQSHQGSNFANNPSNSCLSSLHQDLHPGPRGTRRDLQRPSARLHRHVRCGFWQRNELWCERDRWIQQCCCQGYQHWRQPSGCGGVCDFDRLCSGEDECCWRWACAWVRSCCCDRRAGYARALRMSILARMSLYTMETAL